MSSKHLLTPFLSALKLDDYISFDLETTGLNPQADRITEIAACHFVDGEIKDQYTTLINPGIPVPKNIVEITGITDDMLRDAPCIGDVLPALIEFIGCSSLVGHNIAFDYEFINRNCAKYNILFPEITMYDTLSLSRTFIYFHNSFSLTSLCDYFNISIGQAHRAGADALATGILFKYLVQEALSRPLALIQKIEAILKNSTQINNHQLFTNIIKTAVKFNSIGGLMDSISEYKSPNNIFGLDSSQNDKGLPNTPIEWFDDGLINDNWDGYEKRLSQLDLIKDVYSAFSDDYILIAEAGTGLGKSLAYLTAGFLASSKKDKPLVISTYTKNLQEQLFEIDIPQFSKAVNININAVIYKGRNNYICQTRLESVINNHTHLLSAHEYDAFITLIVWEWETQTGDINECNGFQINRFNRLWSLVRSERGYCNASRCRKNVGCYLVNLRKKVKNADIIIVNHALFSHELQLDNTCIPDDFIYVIDEAHHFANVIRSQLIQEFAVHTLNDVFNFFNYNNHWKLDAVKKHSHIYKLFKQLNHESSVIQKEMVAFFDSYYSMRSQDVKKSDYYMEKYLYRNSQEEFIDTSPNPWDILISLQDFEINIQQLKKLLIENKEQIPKSVLIEFEMVVSCLLSGISNLHVVLDSGNKNVKWASFFQKEFRPSTILNSAPLRVNKFIYDNLLRRYPSGLFCSATLTVNEEFTYFSDKTGLNLAALIHRVEEKIYPSPFYYHDQVKLFVYNNAIDVKDPDYIGNIAQQLDKISISLKRRMLVLCTSYKQILSIKQILEPKIEKDKRCLIVQKPGINRNILVSHYLEHPHSILIGTASFWEGVDFPGDKVEILCIVKAPFDNPHDPLIQSQIEDYIQHGENAFLQFQVPEAAMKLRQGFGRLIRNITDTGICIIMDTRLCHRNYGKIILGSLPVEAVPYQHVSKLISDAQKFF